MPDLVLNCAFITRTPGTDDPVFSTVTGRNRDPRAYLTNGQEVFYYRRYKGSKSGFENAIGNWRAATNSIERTSIESSSAENGTDPVSWGSGLQIIDVSFSPGMVVADDDPRLDTVAVGDLGTAADIDGTEAWIAEQGGEGIDLTAAQVLGDPVRQARTHGRNYLRGYSDFSRTLPTFSATSGAICDQEPWVAYFSGTGASVRQYAGVLGLNALGLNTGTDTNGYASIQHLQYPNIFDPNKNYQCIYKGGLQSLPSVEAFTAQIGFTTVATALATAGMYFEASEASANWQAVVRANPSNVTKKDTGVALAADTNKRFKIVFDPTPGDIQTRFYINEVLVATTIPSERIVAALTALQMTAQIRKTAGTTAAGIAFSDHSYAIETAELVGF